MKVLLVTGRLAEHAVYESALQQSDVGFCVKVLPISVAALLTPEFISRELEGEDLTDYDLVVIPGTVRGDTSVIEKTVGLPVFKGTRHASDIPALFEALGHLELSKTSEADPILQNNLQDRITKTLEAADHPDDSILHRPWNMIIGREKNRRLPIGPDFPMRVVAEILDAPTLNDEQLLKRASYYVENGAEVIDIGMRAEDPRPDEVTRIVSLLKSKLTTPISLDTFNPEDIDAGLKNGVDLLLSLNSSNVQAIRDNDNASDVAVVVVPDRTESGEAASLDNLVERRIASLEENIARAREKGFKKIIADPIMDPLIFPGVTTSIMTSSKFSSRNKDVPLLFGVGNVTELIDADSVGVNAALAGIAQELGANLLLTTEGSEKTKGAVNELARASNMMYLAKTRNTPPKDVGINLLVLKEKRSREIPYDEAAEVDRQKILISKQGSEPAMDPKGFFKVSINRTSSEIVVTHFEPRMNVPDVVVKGKDPLAIRDTLSKLGLVSTLEHAYYLGVEIEKARIASQLNRSYYQDEELFEQNSIL
jgi:dihydropteroate synthase-like protein